MSRHHEKKFPGESQAYREARDRLLQAEIDLRRQVGEVAALRRELPLGGVVPQDAATVRERRPSIGWRRRSCSGVSLAIRSARRRAQQ